MVHVDVSIVVRARHPGPLPCLFLPLIASSYIQPNYIKTSYYFIYCGHLARRY